MGELEKERRPRGRSWATGLPGVAWVACALLLSGTPLDVLAGDDAQGRIEADFQHHRSLRLQFPQPMQTWENRVDPQAIRLTPALPVQCTWTSDTLIDCGFAPGASSTPATRYRIDLAAGLKTQTGRELPAQVLHAETTRPSLHARIGEWRGKVPVLYVLPTLPVTAEAAAEVLRLSVDGQPVALPPLRELPGHSWQPRAFTLELSGIQGNGSRVELAATPGLLSTAGPLRGTGSGVLLRSVINEPFVVRGGDCSGITRDQPAVPDRDGHLALDCVPGTALSLIFSERPDAASRQRFAEALPGEVTLSGWSEQHSVLPAEDDGPAYQVRPGWAARLLVERAGVDTGFEVPADLRSVDGATLPHPLRVGIRTGPYRPRLHAPHVRALVADGRARDMATLARVQNAGPLGIAMTALGAQPHGERFLTPVAAPYEQQPVSPPGTRRVLAEGGWVSWVPEHDGIAPPIGRETGLEDPYARLRSSRHEALQFAAPGFDLFAVAGRREVLVWANDWDGRTPVADARVELLWRDDAAAAPRSLAAARTGPDGVARLRLPAGFTTEAAGDGARWTLRGTRRQGRETERAVLPAWSAGGYGVPLGQAAPTRLWGVADRPLYRAGDTVRYHLWQRDLAGGRLLRPADHRARELRLIDREQHKVIRRWQATPGPSGGFVGELELPLHLTDSTYCIGAGHSGDAEGTCFFVGTYRAQDLWVQAQAQAGEPVLRDGDRFVVDVEAGYYSGGPAADLQLARITTLLRPLPLQSAYPQYRDYHFIDVHAGARSGGVALAGEQDEAPSTDTQGRARIDLPVSFAAGSGAAGPPAFGQLQLVTEARLEGREGTASNAATARYSGYDRFVGLRLEPRRIDTVSPVSLQGVVIDADGTPVPEAPVVVQVHYLPGYSREAGEDTPEPELLVTCPAPTDRTAGCDFPRERPGRYVLTASSGDAAPAEIVQYIWGSSAHPARPGRTNLEVLQPPEHAGGPLRAVLAQPYPRASVLFVFTNGDTILGYQVEDIAAASAGFELPTHADWRGSPVLHAFVREAAPSQVADGYRTPHRLTSLRADVELALPADEPEQPVTVAFDATTAAPGTRRTVALHNASEASREVVLAVVDDALRALASDFLPYFDPHGAHWLGAANHRRGQVTSTSFAAWSNPRPWSVSLLPGQDPDGDDPPVVFDSPAAMGAPAPPPAPPAPPASLQDTTNLDRVEVTGGRLSPAGLLAEGTPQRDLHPGETAAAAGDHALQALARVRTQFADAALWRTDLVLAPGETREIEFTLPDNLTRWRAVAWSSDADDDFHVAEAVLEAGLPLEARLQAPVRVYPGDRARLGANLRQTGDTPVEATATLQLDGPDGPLRHEQIVALAPRGQAGFALEIAPEQTGMLQAIAGVHAPTGRDAVASAIEVASPTITARRLQAGWIGEAPLALDLPTLPESTSHERLRVSLLPGLGALTTRWTSDLHALGHRSWEQILSRAVGAALALERGDADLWPDAHRAIDEALDNAAVFQGHDGDFRFFADSPTTGYGGWTPRPQVALTAYALRAFAVLRAAGHDVDPEVEANARSFLQQHIDRGRMQTPTEADELAIALGSTQSPDPQVLDGLHTRWPELSLPARLSLARALRDAGHPHGAEAIASLLSQAPARGLTRVLNADTDITRWMGSPMREQCGLIDLLANTDVGETHAAARRGLVAGLSDLYAGGVPRVDSQTAVACLLAVRDLARPDGGHDVSVFMQPGTDEGTLLTLPVGSPRVDWEGTPSSSGPLHLRPQAMGDAPASYIAEIEYREDARQARASSVGLAIERRYEVLRDRAWVEAAGQHLHENDWLRISLVVRTGAPRYFVAVTDAAPGGLAPTDLALAGIGGLDLEQVSDEGSWWFRTRRLDPRAPRFYAEYLPAGEHVLHYFARAANAGDYLAAPASVELMYGDASAARTAAQRITIQAAGPTP